MRVVFVQDVPNVAEAGDVKEVRRGFAKNYLFPQSLAVPATTEELKRVEVLRRAAAQVRERQSQDVEALGQRLEGTVLTVVQRAGPTGRLYGSVTAGVIAEALGKEANVSVDRRMVELKDALRQTGEYVVQVRLGPERAYDVKVVVTTEELLRQRALAQEAALQAGAPPEAEVAPMAVAEEAAGQEPSEEEEDEEEPKP